MRDRSGQEIADHVETPRAEIFPGCAAQPREPLKGAESHAGADDDQQTRTDSRHDDGTGPDGQQHRDRRAECDELNGPAVIVAEIVEEEGDVVVRETSGNAEREKTRGDDPPAVKSFFHVAGSPRFRVEPNYHITVADCAPVGVTLFGLTPDQAGRRYTSSPSRKTRST